jgi:hypothetical protein
MRVENTGAETETCSAAAICWRRAVADIESCGVKRNLEHREARGSIILPAFSCRLNIPKLVCSPSHVVADKTEPCYTCVVLHYTTQGALCILSHRICFIKNYDLEWWTRIGVPVRRNRLSSGSLSRKVFDFFADD